MDLAFEAYMRNRSQLKRHETPVHQCVTDRLRYAFKTTLEGPKTLVSLRCNALKGGLQADDQGRIVNRVNGSGQHLP
jgi:hypothetical protein